MFGSLISNTIKLATLPLNMAESIVDVATGSWQCSKCRLVYTELDFRPPPKVLLCSTCVAEYAESLVSQREVAHILELAKQVQALPDHERLVSAPNPKVRAYLTAVASQTLPCLLLKLCPEATQLPR